MCAFVSPRTCVILVKTGIQYCMSHIYFVYIMASQKNGTLYIGVSNNLERRIFEHKNNLIPGFTSKYHIHTLVYYEHTDNINAALQREKQLKKWDREWKIELIEQDNPEWNDLGEHGSPFSRG